MRFPRSVRAWSQMSADLLGRQAPLYEVAKNVVDALQGRPFAPMPLDTCYKGDGFRSAADRAIGYCVGDMRSMFSTDQEADEEAAQAAVNALLAAVQAPT